MKRSAMVLSALALCAMCAVPQLACSGEQLDQVRDASKEAANTRDTACHYVAVFAPSEPRLEAAMQKCREGAELQEVLAAAAGETACRAAYPVSSAEK